MIAKLNRIFDTGKYGENLAQKDLARLAFASIAVVTLLFTIFIVAIPVRDNQRVLDLMGVQPGITVTVIAMYLTAIASWFILRAGRYDIGQWSPAFATAMIILLVVQLEFDSPDDGSLLAMFILLGAIFARQRGIMVTLSISLVIVILVLLTQTVDPLFPDHALNTGEAASLVFQLMIASIILSLYLRNTQIEQEQRTVAISEERYSLAALTTQIATGVLRRTDLQDTLNSAIEEIRDKYPRAYHVQIFLVDKSRRSARLAASTGDVGKMLLARQHSLPVGSVSVIGQVTSNNQSVIARSGSGNTVHKRNEFLPETVVEAAFPLRSGDTVIGALDMQSKQSEAFPDDQLPIFQALADNIAIAIDNARLLEQAQMRVRENQRLTEQAQFALREVERLNRQITAQSWQEYVEKKAVPAMTVEMDTDVVTSRADYTPTLQEAIASGRLVQKTSPNGLVVAVPLVVRGQSIGGLEFELAGSELLDADTIEVIEAVCERLGLAAESVRLFEESRTSAQREAMVNEITGRMQSSNSINSVLSEAAHSIQETLKAQRVAIRLGQPPAPRNGHGEKKGSP